LEVEIRYAGDLILRVSDNGVGIDPIVVDRVKDTHFGLRGMRERADRIGSKLTFVSSPNAGTEVRLLVPGAIIFRPLVFKGGYRTGFGSSLGGRAAPSRPAITF
jgi:signal transduction histidine kinase